MLVLSRKIGEKIHVGDDITIEVAAVAGNRVTLAVDAPREVRILRGELKEAAESFESRSRARVALPRGRGNVHCDTRSDGPAAHDAARAGLSHAVMGVGSEGFLACHGEIV